MTDYQPISPETRTRLEYLAMRVQADLAVAGIPLIPGVGGMRPSATSGAEVFVDSLEPNGVLVDWHNHEMLTRAATETKADILVAGDLTVGNPHSAWMQAIYVSMQEAMRGILTAAGWPVTDHDTGHVVLLLVGRREAESPWLAWHQQQRERSDERWRDAVNARHRQECDLHEDDDSDDSDAGG